MISPRKWDESFDMEFLTPEENKASDRRVAEIQRKIEAQHRDRAKLIKGLSFVRDNESIVNSESEDALNGAIVFLKAQELMIQQEEARILSLEEVKAYLADEEQDKNPLWVQWASKSILGGWVLSHTVEDLVWKYESIYQAHWVLWTRKPTNKQRKAVIWVDDEEGAKT